jgi:diguanylate cyclase (GGDEF)-like protein
MQVGHVSVRRVQTFQTNLGEGLNAQAMWPIPLSVGHRKALSMLVAAMLVVSASTADAQDDVTVVRDVISAIEAGDTDRYQLLMESLFAQDAPLPVSILEALTEGDVALATFGARLMESSDAEIYNEALQVIEREQGFLPEHGPEPGAGGVSPPLPGAAPGMRVVDLEGLVVLDVLDSRQLDVPESARAVLNVMPRRGSGVSGPRPVDYESARREVQQITLTGAGDGSTGKRGFGKTQSIVVLAGAMAAAVAAGMWVRGRKHHGLAELAMTDALTGLKNRRQLDLDFHAQRRCGKRPTALLMIDIDNFKAFNDLHGHATGDAVLRLVGAAIAAGVRTGDVPYRYGGEEFCVLLPETDDAAAGVVADRVRQLVAAIDIGVSRVTASVGVASGQARNVDSTATEADKALYSAKISGRNQVVHAGSATTAHEPERCPGG